jgi:hypothetical protein
LWKREFDGRGARLEGGALSLVGSRNMTVFGSGTLVIVVVHVESNLAWCTRRVIELTGEVAMACMNPIKGKQKSYVLQIGFF